MPLMMLIHTFMHVHRDGGFGYERKTALSEVLSRNSLIRVIDGYEGYEVIVVIDWIVVGVVMV